MFQLFFYFFLSPLFDLWRGVDLIQHLAYCTSTLEGATESFQRRLRTNQIKSFDPILGAPVLQNIGSRGQIGPAFLMHINVFIGLYLKVVKLLSLNNK